MILAIEFDDQKQILTSWHGDRCDETGDYVEISGLFAEKLGLRDSTKVSTLKMSGLRFN